MVRKVFLYVIYIFYNATISLLILDQKYDEHNYYRNVF